MKIKEQIMSHHPFWLAACLPLACSAAAVEAAAPALMQGTTLTADQPLTMADWLVSEKLDGVRARWTGHALMTRSGYPISAPQWFTRNLPPLPLDGELWLGRGRFAEISALVRSGNATDPRWREVQFAVFDLPLQDAGFAARISALKTLLKAVDNPHIHSIEQRTLSSRAELDQLLKTITAQGGEGLMLQHRDSRYQSGRSDLLLKYKPYADAEARVVDYTEGQGKYRGMTGALIVETDAGVRFRLGSGLSDAERENPPPLGSRVTYRYNGLTSNGKPRFARFLRVYDPQL
jgi:DNA ligase-1